MALGKKFQMEQRMQTKLWRPESKVLLVPGCIEENCKREVWNRRIIDSRNVRSSREHEER